MHNKIHKSCSIYGFIKVLHIRRKYEGMFQFFFYLVEHRIIIICLFGIRALCFFLSTGHPMMGGGGEAHPGLGAEHPGFD